MVLRDSQDISDAGLAQVLAQLGVTAVDLVPGDPAGRDAGGRAAASRSPAAQPTSEPSAGIGPDLAAIITEIGDVPQFKNAAQLRS